MKVSLGLMAVFALMCAAQEAWAAGGLGRHQSMFVVPRTGPVVIDGDLPGA